MKEAHRPHSCQTLQSAADQDNMFALDVQLLAAVASRNVPQMTLLINRRHKLLSRVSTDPNSRIPKTMLAEWIEDTRRLLDALADWRGTLIEDIDTTKRRLQTRRRLSRSYGNNRHDGRIFAQSG
jgi:hypothetical protein